jgi:hypothetical protein
MIFKDKDSAFSFFKGRRNALTDKQLYSLCVQPRNRDLTLKLFVTNFAAPEARGADVFVH